MGSAGGVLGSAGGRMGSELDEDACCWVCLCSDEGSQGLQKVCGCPKQCHLPCLARWQLQQAGKREERCCRFCGQNYPDWRNALTPPELKPTTAVMCVSVRGRLHKVAMRPGADGQEEFKRQIRQLSGVSDDVELDVIFNCKTPHNGEKVRLRGFSAFDAVAHCAAISAAKRLQNTQQLELHTQPLDSSKAADTCSNTGRQQPVSNSRATSAAVGDNIVMQSLGRILEPFRQLLHPVLSQGEAGVADTSVLTGSPSNDSSAASTSSALLQ